MRNLLSFVLFMLLMVSGKSSAQIVTSKKEAQKKGLYSYVDKETSDAVAAFTGKPAKANEGPAKPAKSPAATETVKPAKKEVVLAYEPVKESRKGGPSKVEAPARKKSRIVETEDPDFVPAPYENYLAQQIVNNAMQFEGVPYRGGGTTKAGMDCSGMVYATFQIFDITLPRSSHEMAKAGTKIDLKDVRKGDLLFFDNNPRRSRINHVGIVTEVTPEGEVKFLHSSSSSGVIVSSMNEAYHARTYVSAGRVIEDETKI